MEQKRIFLVLNPNAGSPDQREQLRMALVGREEVACRESTCAGDCVSLTRRALEQDYDCIAVAGGDGTLNGVVNGLLQASPAGHAEPALGVVPLGTGNDFARTLDIPLNPRDALDLLTRVETRVETVDAIRVETEHETVYGVNAVSGGFSGEVDEALTPEMKETWGPLAYLLGSARALPQLEQYNTYVAFDGTGEEEMDVVNIIVANGRYVGGGRHVAPPANPSDGELDAVVVKWGDMLDLSGMATSLVTGTLLENPHVHHRRVRRLSVRSTPEMWFRVDGELFSEGPVTVEVVEGALRMVVGADFEPDSAQL